MQVILLERVAKLGQMGDVVAVPGIEVVDAQDFVATTK